MAADASERRIRRPYPGCGARIHQRDEGQSRVLSCTHTERAQCLAQRFVLIMVHHQQGDGFAADWAAFNADASSTAELEGAHDLSQ
mgnify:FL=1